MKGWRRGTRLLLTIIVCEQCYSCCSPAVITVRSHSQLCVYMWPSCLQHPVSTLHTTTAYDHLLKILIVGDRGSNKRTLLSKYIGDAEMSDTTTLGEYPVSFRCHCSIILTIFPFLSCSLIPMSQSHSHVTQSQSHVTQPHSYITVVSFLQGCL